MDIKIGELRINLSALKLYKHNDGLTIDPYIAAMKKSQPLYTWDCVAGTGVPPRKPKLSVDALVKFLVSDFRGLPDNDESMALLADTLEAADYARVKDFDAAVQTQFKLIVPIDWDKLWLPYKDEYSLTINRQVKYLECIGRPYGMEATDYIYFFIPVHITFQTVLGTTCGGILPEGATFTRPPTRRSGTQISEKVAELEAQIDREEEEARRRTIPDFFFGLDFNHEGTLLDDEDGNNAPPNENNEDDEDH